MAGLNWQGACICGLRCQPAGTEVLCEHLLTHLKSSGSRARVLSLPRAEKQRQIVVQQEAREHIKELRERHFEKRHCPQRQGRR